jgi:rfaE bifunctional protein nucleotidyltransferase chain/domain
MILNSATDTFLKQCSDMKVVFTNGCFDILHAGHVSYLNEAKSLGDILIVGLNSDLSVKRLKGPQRPINHEQNRKFILENLKAIDHVVIFEEDTPLSLIEAISPHVLVKGGDWQPHEIVGSDHVLSCGGEVKSLKFIEGESTTSIINKAQDRS